MKKRFVMALVTVAAATALLFALCGGALAALYSTVTVGAGETWTVAETSSMNKLVIGEGGAIAAPQGKSVTLTVNGVEKAAVAGTYEGAVVVTVTDAITIQPWFGPPQPPVSFRTAVYVDNGVYVPAKSVRAAVVGGTVTSNAANDVRITSVGPLFNGFMIGGASIYTINNPVIDFTGPGANDFLGSAAGIRIDGSSDVTINNPRIVTNGVIRTAIWAGGNSNVTLNNAYIKTGSPPVPAPEDRYGAFMVSSPWPLGLTGSCRSTLAVESAKVTYNNSYIAAEGWGALSTDACRPGPVLLTANNCTIETLRSGYGAYADGNCHDVFNNCTFNVTDMAVIQTQGDVTFNNTVVNSGRFGVMQHSGEGPGREILTIKNGTVFNTNEACIMIKSSAPIINVDNAKLNPKNGVLLHVMVSDDKGSGTNAGTTVANFSNVNLSGDIINSMTGVMVTPPEMGPPPGGDGGPPPGGDGPPPGGDGPPPGGDGPPIGPPPGGDGPPPLTAAATPVLVGGDLLVTFSNATITGAVTTATHWNEFEVRGVDAPGDPFDTSNYEYSPWIGRGKTVYGLPDNDKDGIIDPFGLKATFKQNSTWVVSKTSYLTGLTIEKGSSVVAPPGHKLRMTVNGVWAPLGPGSYDGTIVLSVIPLRVFGGTSLAPRSLPATD